MFTKEVYNIHQCVFFFQLYYFFNLLCMHMQIISTKKQPNMLNTSPISHEDMQKDLSDIRFIQEL